MIISSALFQGYGLNDVFNRKIQLDIRLRSLCFRAAEFSILSVITENKNQQIVLYLIVFLQKNN